MYYPLTDYNMQSLREKLFGKAQSLRDKIESFSINEAEAMSTTKSPIDEPVLKAPSSSVMPKKDTAPEVTVNEGALSPNRMNEKLAPTIPVPNKRTYTLKDRGISFSQDEVEKTLKPMLYSEIAPHGIGTGQRPKEKVELEMRAIVNTVLNRSKNRKKGVTDIINEPNQYQGVGTPKFNNFSTTTDPLEKEQVDFINETMSKIMSEIENGTFQDNVGGAEFYGHLKDGTIRAFDTWAEYKKAIDAGLVK